MKTISLYYRKPAENADKEYHLSIEPAAGGFVVNYANGKRGGTLARGCRSDRPQPLEAAEKLFAKIVKAKISDGYTDAADGTPFNGDAAKLADVLPHPHKEIVNLNTMRNFSARDFLIQRKLDGCLARRTVGGAGLLGELVTARSGAFLTAEDREMIDRHGTFFAAFTVESVHGENVLTRSTRERWGILCSHVAQFPPDVVAVPPAIVPDKLSDEEGYVAHAWGDSWGNMFAVKQSAIYECEVTATGSKQSVEVKVLATGATCRVTLAGGKCDQVRVGSLIRVECLNITNDGKLYQPRPCREWLVRF